MILVGTGNLMPEKMALAEEIVEKCKAKRRR